jgi:hypothetical protein
VVHEKEGQSDDAYILVGCAVMCALCAGERVRRRARRAPFAPATKAECAWAAAVVWGACALVEGDVRCAGGERNGEEWLYTAHTRIAEAKEATGVAGMHAV